MTAVLIHHTITFFFHDDDVICEAQLLRNKTFFCFSQTKYFGICRWLMLSEFFGQSAQS